MDLVSMDLVSKSLEMPYCPPRWENVPLNTNLDVAKLGEYNIDSLKRHVQAERKYWQEWLTTHTAQIESTRELARELQLDIPVVSNVTAVFDHITKYVDQLSAAYELIEETQRLSYNARQYRPQLAFERWSCYAEAGDRVVCYVEEGECINNRPHEVVREDCLHHIVTGSVIDSPQFALGTNMVTVLADVPLYTDDFCSDRRLYYPLDSVALMAFKDARYFMENPGHYEPWLKYHGSWAPKMTGWDLQSRLKELKL